MYSLTEKAKEDFEKWLEVKDYFLFSKDDDGICVLSVEDLHPHILSGYLIDWFDSVGIYVNIIQQKELNMHHNVFMSELTFKNSKKEVVITLLQSRHQATTEAIKQANIIYND